MTDFKLETLIPFIRVTRKLRKCNPRQERDVLAQLPEILTVHDVSSALTDITLCGLCDRNVNHNFTPALYDDIEAILPSDRELNINDSIYESRLMDNLKYRVEGQQPSHRKQSKLTLTILRIPTDLQFHVFHYLDFKELMVVQKVCRALCIAARNPLSLFCLRFSQDYQEAKEYNDHFVNECFSRANSLVIESFDASPNRWRPPFTGNAKWGQCVTDLSVRSWNVDIRYLGQFENLIKCELWCSNRTRTQLNAQITSWYTLKDLTLRIEVTEHIIDEIRKFKNLQKLSLRHHVDPPEFQERREKGTIRWDPIMPISLPKLKEFSFESNLESIGVFQRILIGSHPETVNVDGNGFGRSMKWIFTQNNATMRAVQAMTYLNVREGRTKFIAELLPLLQKIQSASTTNAPLSMESTVTDWGDQHAGLQPIIAFFQYVMVSKLKLAVRAIDGDLSTCWMERAVGEIFSAPFGTFTEIFVQMSFDVLMSKDKDEWFTTRACRNLTTELNPKSDCEIISGVIMHGIDEAENWMKPWLVFDENNMKGIGLRRLQIEFICDLEEDEGWWNLIECQGAWTDDLRRCRCRYKAVMDTMADKWIEQRADNWADIDSRCAVLVHKQKMQYAVTLTLHA